MVQYIIFKPIKKQKVDSQGEFKQFVDQTSPEQAMEIEKNWRKKTKQAKNRLFTRILIIATIVIAIIFVIMLNFYRQQKIACYSRRRSRWLHSSTNHFSSLESIGEQLNLNLLNQNGQKCWDSLFRIDITDLSQCSFQQESSLYLHIKNYSHMQSINYSINCMFQARTSHRQNRPSRLSNPQDEPFLRGARQNFVKKVYSTLSLQLILTTFFVYYTTVSPVFAYFLDNNTWLFWISFLGAIVTLVVLQFGNLSSIYPTNYLVMAVFTICESIMVSFCCTGFDPQSILLSALATLSASFGLTYYAMTTKQDLTSSTYIGKGMFYSFVWTISIISILNLIFLRSNFIALALAVGFAIVYSLYLLIDTQLILGNRQKRINLDDYIWGATKLYTDIISIFLELLRVLGKQKRKDE